MTLQPDMLADLPGEGLPARQAALRIIEQVLGRKTMLDLVLERESAFLDLPARDRAFTRMLVATVLRRKGQMDDLIARALNKGEAPRPESLRWILYIGIAQILFMEVADHAAVDTSVSLAAQNGMEGKKGFVNAVLRRMTNDGRQWAAAQDVASLNIPDWLYTQWTADYGAARAREIALASLEEAALDITVKDDRAKKDWAAKLDALVLPTGTLRGGGGFVPDLEGFDEGAWWVQDAASALAVRMLGDIRDAHVLDLCAAPGGKTAQLAAAGAKVTALDRSASRMAILSENIKRLGLADAVQTVTGDGAVWSAREKFTHILLDAPCSATGTIRRHPDLLALKNPKDQTGLMGIQERLLANAAHLLEDGGVLVYCTCSLQKDEGERQIGRFLAASPAFRRVPIRKEEFGGMDGLVNAEGEVRILPSSLREFGGMDGFFIARLQKNS